MVPSLVRCQRRVDRGAGDRAMPEPGLDGPSVVALVGQRVAAGAAHLSMGELISPRDDQQE